jgi:formylglycine-generating enzyme required for sulfatase activity
MLGICAGLVLLLLLLMAVISFSRKGGNSNLAGGNPNNTNSGRATPKAPQGMVYVPGGEFTMGNDMDGDTLERPAHKVRVGAFFIDKYEVTCAEYARFLRESGYPRLPDGWAGRDCPAGQERRPVSGVQWLDANAYANWAGKRLPLETEWEFAARGPGEWRYPWGNEWRPSAANVGGTLGRIADVGQYEAGASPYDVFDMIGNVWEWTASDLVTYSGKPLPATVSNHGVTVDVTFGKVIRGGSWQDTKEYATTTLRRGYPPEGDNDYSSTGFRCVKDVAPTP